jgi:hypothetical protein
VRDMRCIFMPLPPTIATDVRHFMRRPARMRARLPRTEHKRNALLVAAAVMLAPGSSQSNAHDEDKRLLGNAAEESVLVLARSPLCLRPAACSTVASVSGERRHG